MLRNSLKKVGGGEGLCAVIIISIIGSHLNIFISWYVNKNDVTWLGIYTLYIHYLRRTTRQRSAYRGVANGFSRLNDARPCWTSSFAVYTYNNATEMCKSRCNGYNLILCLWARGRCIVVFAAARKRSRNKNKKQNRKYKVNKERLAVVS